MMKLPEPKISFTKTFEDCTSGVTGNLSLQQNFVLNKALLLAGEKIYVDAAKAGKLYAVPSLKAKAKEDPEIFPKLHRSDLIKLYDQYLVAAEKPARYIYDELLNSAKEMCPFCGGIGKPRNLDHFLPKSQFPQFSVLPRNLVPSCRDCNMDGKGQSYALGEEQQIIQPYLDQEHFFSEQWVYANYHGKIDDEPGHFEYYVEAPPAWNKIDQSRARSHFDDFELGRRYSVKAAEILGITLEQIRRMRKRGLSDEIIKEDLVIPGIEKAPFVNHWLRGMYQSLYAAL